jgi:hypothetical protein
MKNILDSIKSIVTKELPAYCTAEIDLVFGNLCEGQEDNFKILIDLFWNEKAADFDRAKEEAEAAQCTYRIGQRLHERYGRDNLLISFRLPACHQK